MPVLRIQHGVSSYDAWKQVFDGDPIDRRGGGVLRYRIDRPVDDPNFVVVDLEFDDAGRATAFLGRLRELWEGPGRDVMRSPQAWILETAEAADV